MRRPRFGLRTLGSFAIVAISFVTLLYATRLLLFTIDLQGMEAATNDKAPAIRTKSSQLAKRFEPWLHDYGLSGMASRSLALNSAIPMSVGQRLQLDASALSENPTDGLLWLAYARNIAQSGIDLKNATEAVDVSRLVGRREQVIMVDRILFTLSNWTRFPLDERTAALREIHDLRWFLRPAERTAIEEAIASNDDSDREYLRKQVASAMAN